MFIIVLLKELFVMKNTVLKKISYLMLLGFLGNQVLASEEKTLDFECIYALQCRDLNQIEKCFNGLPNINDQDEKGHTYLHFAALFSIPDAVEYLIEKGLDPKIKSKDGRTPLHSAASSMYGDDKSRKGVVKIIKHLIHQGVDVNAQSDKGMTALHMAVEKRHKKAVEALLEAEDIDQSLIAVADTMWYGEVMPSHVAIFDGQLDVLELLIQKNVEKTFAKYSGGNTVVNTLEDMKLVYKEELAVDEIRANYNTDAFAYIKKIIKDEKKMEQFIKIFDDYFSYAKPADL